MLSVKYMLIEHIVSVGQRYVALHDIELKTRATTVENSSMNNEELTNGNHLTAYTEKITVFCILI